MKALIAWFATNGVVANLLMFLVVAVGLMSVFTVNQEVFPDFEAELITVSVPYRGAAPAEVEAGVNVRIEEAVEGLEGVKRITSTASEGSGVVMIEAETGFDLRELLDNVKARVDAISTFPLETEEPIVQEALSRLQVVNVSIYGDTDEQTLKELGQRIRDEIVALDGISQADLKSVRPYEISIEVSEDDLRRYGLTFDDVASAVRRSSLDMPGGSVKADSGEVLLRTTGQRYEGDEFRDLTLLTRPDGSRIRLGDVAQVVDGFEESDQWSRFDGYPAVMIQIYRVGEENAPDVARTVRDYVQASADRLPPGISIATWQDTSVLLEDRQDLLLRNGFNGLILVFIVLTLFLRMRLAAWVAVGIPVAFLGAIAMMPYVDITINMMTLFAFILVLGIVVDDAIVVAERIHARHEQGDAGLEGAIRGAQEVSVPVIFGVLTTMVAFVPFMLVPGLIGNFTRAIPLVVIPVLAFSVLESQFVLPYHLSHHTPRKQVSKRNLLVRLWDGVFTGFSNGLDGFVRRIYRPVLETAIEWRYATAALAVSSLLVTGGLVGGGVVEWVFFPEMDSDNVIVTLTMPEETPAAVTASAIEGIERAALEVGRELEEEFGFALYHHVLTSVGEQPSANSGPGNPGLVPGRPYLGEVNIELIPGDARPLSSAAIGARLRERVPSIAGAVELAVRTELMGGAQKPIDIQLSGSDTEVLRALAAEVRGVLAQYPGVIDITDSFRSGKPEIELAIRPSAEGLGLSLEDLGRQVRQGFFGEEAQRIQRGRDDVRVMVRYPVDERRSLGDLEYMRVRTPEGAEVPFGTVADAELGRGFSSIRRVDRQRAINVTADVDSEVANAQEVISDLDAGRLRELVAAHPGVTYSFEGEMQMQEEFLGGLLRGFGVALFCIFALLAIPFRSYIQPVIVMTAVPFGLVGAVIGHVVMGMEMNFMSMMGMVAVAGVAVNDSLVLVHFVNRRVHEGLALVDAVREAGVTRFRPILLTSMTTAAGVTPLMLETSLQARFLIPMALALASGVLFATLVTLLFVPSMYVIIEDIKRLLGLESRHDDTPAPVPAG
jgi:multidrug efflux pump subunit AcrB